MKALDEKDLPDILNLRIFWSRVERQALEIEEKGNWYYIWHSSQERTIRQADLMHT